MTQPGGTVTGLSVTHPEISLKQLELLKQAQPAIGRVALLFASADLADRDGLLALYDKRAQQLGT